MYMYLNKMCSEAIFTRHLLGSLIGVPGLQGTFSAAAVMIVDCEPERLRPQKTLEKKIKK